MTRLLEKKIGILECLQMQFGVFGTNLANFSDTAAALKVDPVSAGLHDTLSLVVSLNKQGFLRI
jgi:hypothetical protein